MQNEVWQNSSFEGEIVKYYETYFYNGKQETVNKTVAYIKNKVDKWMKKSSQDLSLVDIGCGTGIYEDGLSEIFSDVTAIDLSADMIGFAEANHKRGNVRYSVHNICHAPAVNDKADVTISMSHVIGYQINNDLLRPFIKNIAEGIKSGGLFIFNFYNEPALLCGKLEPKVHECITPECVITRHSTATPILMENVLEEKYKYHVKRTQGSDEEDILIREKMRYFTVLELENYLTMNGMEILEVNNFLTDDDLTGEEWNGCITARKR